MTDYTDLKSRLLEYVGTGVCMEAAAAIADLEADRDVLQMTQWQPIETAPKGDGVLHVRGVWVHSATTGDRLYFDACAGYLEAGEFLAADGEDHGWSADDFTHWMPLPEPPKVTE